MSDRRPSPYLIAGVLVLITAVGLLLLIAFRPNQSVDEPVLTQRFESAAFSFRYPQGWRHTIPDQNLVFLADPAVLDQQPGASMTVQRSLRLMTEVDNPREALALFLERGPLAQGRAWTIVTEAEARQIAGREAYAAVLEGAESPDAPVLHSEVIVTEADSGVFYVFALSVPLEQWPDSGPIFDAILDSVQINE